MPREYQAPAQMFKISGRTTFLEVMADALPIGQIMLRFIEYDPAAPTGQKATTNIPYYLSTADAELMACDIKSGRIAKLGQKSREAAKAKGSKYPDTIWMNQGGMNEDRAKREDGKALARVLKITPGSRQPWVISAETGPGHSSETGLIIPDYGLKPEKIVRVPCSDDDLKKLANIVQHLVNYWYNSKLSFILDKRMDEAWTNIVTAHQNAVDEKRTQT